MRLRYLAGCVVALAVVGCDEDDPAGPDEERTFTIVIENVSQSQTLPVDRLDGTIPLSPGVFVRYDGDDPLFEVGEAADEGTERIAEDGDNSVKAAAVGTVAGEKGAFSAPGGADGQPTIGPGESVTLTVTARPGDRLQFQTMFAQSNDWFYAFGNGGLELFLDDTPVSGDVTAQVVLYDAGTEVNTAPGTGPDQAPVQAAPNTGPAESGVIAVATGFTIPATESVIRITVTPQAP